MSKAIRPKCSARLAAYYDQDYKLAEERVRAYLLKFRTIR